MSTKQQDVAGWNDRFSAKRNKGNKGFLSKNIFPQPANLPVAIADPAGNYDTADTIPALSQSVKVTITVTEVFNNTPTLTVGTDVDPDLFVTLADTVDLTQLGTTEIVREVTVSAVNAGVLRAVIGGTPNQGAGSVELEYVI